MNGLCTFCEDCILFACKGDGMLTRLSLGTLGLKGSCTVSDIIKLRFVLLLAAISAHIKATSLSVFNFFENLRVSSSSITSLTLETPYTNLALLISRYRIHLLMRIFPGNPLFPSQQLMKIEFHQNKKLQTQEPFL